MKKTISVSLGKEVYLIAIMDAIGFAEVERKSTGGYMSEEKLQMTFSGDEKDYNEGYYIKVPMPNGAHYYYSLRYPDGFFTSSYEKFKNAHDKANTNNFELCSFA